MAVHLHFLLLHTIILLVWAIKASAIHCPTSCGNVSEIRYPFGIGEGCYYDEWFAVTCDNSSGSPVPFLSRTNLKLAEDVSRRSKGMANGLRAYVNTLEAENLSRTPFYFSHKLNKFMATGCNSYTTTFKRHQIKSKTRCLPICTCDPAKDKRCYDLMCTISSSLQAFSVPENCTGALMVEQDWLMTNYLANTNANVSKERELFPVVIEFGRYMGKCLEPYKSRKTYCNKDGFCLTQLKSGFFCVCSQPKEKHDESGCTGNLFCTITSHNDCSNCPGGYTSIFSHNGDKELICYSSKIPGNKIFIIIGCSSGLGMLLLGIGAWWLYKFVKRRKANKLKQKFFKKNGGLLLQRRMSSDDGNIEKPKLFTANELEKATDSYNANRILGEGGQGTVYKGMLEEGKIIAVKRPKKVDESKVDVFINEVVILSQINHRNVVQLLGCCLETEVPLLVYEFIPNGTLFQYIHEQNEEFPLTWDLRLCIAIEVAGALSYLHSSASLPIYHRDIKSSNILLDEKYRAKISDFGVSRSIAVDQTHLTTQVHGTFGYFDPEYFRSSQFTEKSDVYSFGVVLAELLTGQKPIRSTNLEEDKSLAFYFLQIMKENRLFEILDARALKDGREQEIMAFANLTRRCLNLNGRKRPTMREVETKLAGIRTSNEASILKENCDDIEYVDGDTNNQLETSSLCTGSFLDSTTFSID
ncbi:wall-associated receptor kinase-like 10 [Pistacia vera]|uniref:wall-associated receptor kinase-like 10 n=1 Tax=Pistacia vera TaxID=55513 RepID=UPI0012637C35|nr:wall-associated receptor kinase-like 10 [Pistacia vera]